MIVPSTRLLAIVAAVVIPAATAAGISSAAWAPSLVAMVVLLGVAAWDAAAGVRRLGAVEVRLLDSLRMTCGGVTPLAVELRNRTEATVALRVGMVMPEGVAAGQVVEEVRTPAGASRLEWRCEGVRRGEYVLRAVWLESLSPLKLWSVRAVRPASARLRVYPNLRDRATAALFLRSAQAGTRVHRQVGKGREFEKLREYAPGDSFEDIHWKATARRGRPTVKLYQVEHAQEVYLVLDCSRLMAREGTLDAYVGAALHLALAAERQGDRFGLVTFSDRPHKLVKARGGAAHFRTCREAIYDLHPRRVAPDFRELFASLQVHLRRRSLLVFFTALDDPLLAESFERELGPLARRHIVLVNTMRTTGVRPLFTGDAGDPYDALAGQILWNRLRELQLSLERRGVRLQMVTQEEIKSQVAGAYLEIKRRQLL